MRRRALLFVVALAAHQQVMDLWATDHYTWVYETVISRSREIGQIMRDRKLMPAH